MWRVLLGILVVVLLLGTIGTLVYKTYQVSARNERITREIDRLKSERDTLHQESTTLADVLAQVNTPEYTDKLAKEAFGKGRSDELLAIYQTPTKDAAPPPPAEVDWEDTTPLGNVQAWWSQIFFNRNTQ
jgi:cell division protein FtsB